MRFRCDGFNHNMLGRSICYAKFTRNFSSSMMIFKHHFSHFLQVFIFNRRRWTSGMTSEVFVTLIYTCFDRADCQIGVHYEFHVIGASRFWDVIKESLKNAVLRLQSFKSMYLKLWNLMLSSIFERKIIMNL